MPLVLFRYVKHTGSDAKSKFELIGEPRVLDGNRQGIPADEASVSMINVFNQLEALGYQLCTSLQRQELLQLIVEHWFQSTARPPQQRRGPVPSARPAVQSSGHIPANWPMESLRATFEP